MRPQWMKAMAGIVLGTLVICGGTVQAGEVSHPQVTVGTGFASGSSYGARTSADIRQNIGCAINSSSAVGATPAIVCSARNYVGTALYCSSRDPRLVESVHAMTDYYYMYFTADTAGQCTYLSIQNFSRHLP